MPAAPPTPLRCALVGADSLLVACGELLLARGHALSIVLTRAEGVRAWAEAQGLPCAPPEQALERLRADPPEHLFAITHLERLAPEVLACARRSAINFHDGPLPRYAGLHATAWALMAGESRHGITWHEMTAELDAGAILAQVELELAPQETSLTLNARCFEAGLESFGALLDALAERRVQGRPQERAQRSSFGRWQRPPAACTLVWSRPARELEALVRALDFGRYPNALGTAKLWTGAQAFTVLAARAQAAQALAQDGRRAPEPGERVPEPGERAPEPGERVPEPGERAPEPGERASEPGEILSLAPELVVATAEGVLALQRLAGANGEELAPVELARRAGLVLGARLPLVDAPLRARLEAAHARCARAEERWSARLAALAPAQPPWPRPQSREGESAHNGSAHAHREHARAAHELALRLPAAFEARFGGEDALAALACAWLARVLGLERFDLAWCGAELARETRGLEPWLATRSVLGVEAALEQGFASWCDALAPRLAELRASPSWLHDLVARTPALAGRAESELLPPIAIVSAEAAPRASEALAFVLDDSAGPRLRFDPARVAPEDARDCVAQLECLAAAIAAEPQRALAQQPLLSAAEREALLTRFNPPAEPWRAACLGELFLEQVARTPQRTALVCAERELSYAELAERAGRLAAHLRARGAGPGTLVGLCLERSEELVVSLWAILLSGAAYLPLDPSLPEARLAYLLADSGAQLVVSDARCAARLGAEASPSARVERILVDLEAEAIAARAPERKARGAPADLAYVIYTSGSTGRPKGVELEHRNVASFFAGIDARIEHAEGGTWLAVTSLSFDISVLELVWTATRGFTVLLQQGGERASAHSAAQAGARVAAQGTAQGTGATRPLDFGLFYFSSDEAQAGADAYRLLLEGARFADEHGFSSVWTPERHFHAFGGLYPHPAVTSAAVAAVTRRVGVRAGSVVLPLHHPIRVAEAWAVVDQLSHGRAGISVAAGWQPDDFVLAPEAYGRHKQTMFEALETVRRLWRGETLEFDGPQGRKVALRTLPRPVQPELPVWVTVAGNPETYVQAGAAGANLLTHLLGQTLDELAPKVAAYRRARAEAGHDPRGGTVTLMLHTFVDEDEARVRALVREPLRRYLASSMALVQQVAWAFPAFRPPANARGAEGARPEGGDELAQLSEEERDAVLEHAFERYFAESGLFGTPRGALAMVERVRACDVDEIACLIDFGVLVEDALAGLVPLARLRALAQPAPRAADDSTAALIRRHRVTHLQCTPSLVRLLCLSEEGREALRAVRHLLIGGEAFPLALAPELARRAPGATLTNLYGPTETTIWSSSARVEPGQTAVGLGRPLANTRFYVLDARGEPVPLGVPGELWIAGPGVARGYRGRPELDRERFRPDPFASAGAGASTERMYRTGDLVRRLRDGELEFLGRADHQVKVRGHRIELGEIERCLEAHPALSQAVVLVRQDAAGEPRLVAYCVPAEKGAGGEGERALAERLRAHARAELPEPMVPAHFALLERLPLLASGKVDRAALPALESVRPAPSARDAGACAPQGELEELVAAQWRETLGLDSVGREDNFFDLGGHSLLVVRLHRALQKRLEGRGTRALALTDLYRYPSVRALAEHLAGDGSDEQAGLALGAERAARRRDALTRRRGGTG